MVLCLQPASLTRKCLQSIYNTERKLNKYKDNSNTRHREVPGEIYEHSSRSHLGLGCGRGGGGQGGQSQGHLAEFNIYDDKVTMVKEDCLR